MTTGRSRREFVRDASLGCVVGTTGVRLTLHRPPNRDTEPPRLVGHRGCALEAPENTLAAVEHSSRVADAVEVDVRRAGSGELVVFHDDTLDRVTDGTGALESHTLEELRDFTVLESDESIPRLEAVFETAPASTSLVLDLKERGIVPDVLDLAAGFDHDVLISSFDQSIVETASTAGADCALIVRETWLARRARGVVARTSVPVYIRQPVNQLLETALELECVAIHPRLELCLRTPLVERAHERGLLVEPWTITSPEEARKLAESGVDGLITDVCAAL
ncbi:glycerophosphodiester phosphodiesterase [Natronosalvus vescus]|uniref:glycerophosphodiester phosphodiesterase n=1 Tax=Natronosalvus vescus TaxID=2953881 RepID=UPI0020900F54|nr:glycerophosphodiester phosphodiesterase family protein [Natronosalvus vescus]